MKQQEESVSIGMWLFLAQEIMFFGGLFTSYLVFRWRFPMAFAAGSNHLDAFLGGANTLVLIVSSLTMALTVYYARLGSWVFFGTMAVISLLTVAIVQALGDRVLPVSVAVFVLAWIAQFVGHKIEGRKPSFFEDLQYLWVGPLFVLSKLFGKLGIRW